MNALISSLPPCGDCDDEVCDGVGVGVGVGVGDDDDDSGTDTKDCSRDWKI